MSSSPSRSTAFSAPWQNPNRYLFAFFHFHSMVRLNSKMTSFLFVWFFFCFCFLFFYLLINSRSGLLVGIRWSFCISKSQRILWILSSLTDSDLCIYHLLCSHISQYFTIFHIAQFPLDHLSRSIVPSFVFLLINSLIIWSTVWYLSSILYLLFCYVLSIFTLM